MKSLLVGMVLAASLVSQAKTFEVCVITEAGITEECRSVTDNRELGVPSKAAQEQVGGDINPVAPSVYSNGTNGKLYKAIDAFFKALGSTGPAVQKEAP